MAAALELLILPAILLTLIAILLLKGSLSPTGLVATAVFLGLLYFFVIKLLRQLRRWDRDQRGERKAFDETEPDHSDSAAHRDPAAR